MKYTAVISSRPYGAIGIFEKRSVKFELDTDQDDEMELRFAAIAAAHEQRLETFHVESIDKEV